MSKKLICLMTLMMICLSTGYAGEVKSPLVFICHKGLGYTAAEVKFAYRGYLDEPRPVDNVPLFHSMLDYIGYSSTRYQKIWNKMFFRRGLFVPKKMATDQEVVNWVAANYAGIGYVTAAPAGNPNIEVCGL